MAGTTTFYKLPYPTGTDRVADGDNAIQALAQKVEATYGQWVAYTPVLAGFSYQAGGWFRWRKDGTTVQVAGNGGLETAAGTFAIRTPPGHDAYLGGLSGYRAIGHWHAIHASVVYNGVAVVAGNGFDVQFGVNGANWVNAASPPASWSVGDQFSFSLAYETIAVPTA